MQPLKFGEDRIMYVGVISFFFFHGEQWPVVELRGSPRPHPLRFEKALQDFLSPMA